MTAAADGVTRVLSVDRRGVVYRTEITPDGRRVRVARVGNVGRYSTWWAVVNGGIVVCEGARTRREALAAIAEAVG